KNPKRSKMVALSAGNMAIYNYYGTYNYLYRGYANLRAYIKQQKFEVDGPMREFYVTDAMLEKDPTKWLTRIMIPVKMKTINT
ncbi:MAG: GyrI-like domain-containing protein, partial [Flammeovirgaceae bacterium]